MSRSLIKIVDSSLLPAALMILSKFLGLIIVAKLTNLPWSIKEYSSNLFSIGNALDIEQVRVLTSYSDMIMFITVALGLSMVIIRAIYLHNTHVKPTLVTRLADKNLLSLITTSYEVYHFAFAWLTFTVLANIIILINAIQGTSYIWVAVIATIFTSGLVVILLQDIYREMENIKKHPSKYQWN